MGSADPPPGKIDEKLKSKNMQKEQFSEWGGGEVIRVMTGWSSYANHTFIQIYTMQNAQFCSQIFKMFFASGDKKALTPPNQNPSWWRGAVVQRRSLAGELSLSCARPAADG